MVKNSERGTESVLTSAPQTLGRRARQKQDKLDRIKAAARELFASQGFAATTTQQIAERADIGTGTLFLYVRSKEEALVLVFHDEMGRVCDAAFAALPRRASLLAQLVRFYSALVAFHEREPGLARVFVKELLFVNSTGLRRSVLGFVDDLAARWAELIEAAKVRGAIAGDVPARVLAENCFAVYALNLQRWLGLQESLPTRAFITRLREAFALQLRGLTTPSCPAASGRRSGARRAIGGRRALTVLVLCTAALPGPRMAAASALLAPAIGPIDNATVGSRVADPQTPAAALFENPAGLAGLDGIHVGAGLGAGFVHQRVTASQPAGYDEVNDYVAFAPDFGVSVPLRDRWRFALGLYGTSGSQFDFPADPALGVPRFFSETVQVAFPIGVAYRLSDRIWLGAEIQPAFGQLRTHFTLAGLYFDYKINGPGVQGMVGVTALPHPHWTAGLAVRTPGMIWMGGSMPLPGVGQQDVSANVQLPTMVLLGTTWRGVPGLALSASIRFTDSSTLGASTIEYEYTPQANIGFVPYASDEWKFAGGAEYVLWDDTALRCGVSWASYIVGARGVSPLVYDTDDTKVAFGIGQRLGAWTIDGMIGYAFSAARTISPDVALLVPGTYEQDGVMVMLGSTYRY